MKSRSIAVICVGKLKTPWWREACLHYLGLLNKLRPVEYIESRDASPDLPEKERKRKECAILEGQISSKNFVIALHETGQEMTSQQFASYLAHKDQCESRKLVFVVGGPFGLTEEFLAKSDFILSLSQCTWPHELARVLLLEQLFRAESILRNSPYHH